jgi:hypothetical protein
MNESVMEEEKSKSNNNRSTNGFDVTIKAVIPPSILKSVKEDPEERHRIVNTRKPSFSPFKAVVINDYAP